MLARDIYPALVGHIVDAEARRTGYRVLCLEYAPEHSHAVDSDSTTLYNVRGCLGSGVDVDDLVRYCALIVNAAKREDESQPTGVTCTIARQAEVLKT